MNQASADSRAQVLVVDDERFFREAIGDALAEIGCSFQVAATAAEALERAVDPSIGAVILDIVLPDRSGLEVLRELRERRPELRVIVLSAHTDQEFVLEALRLGACDYLAKPLHEEELQLSVRRALEAYGLAADSARLRSRLHNAGVELEQLLREDGEGVEGRVLDAVERLLAARKVSLLRRGATEDVLQVAAASGHKTPVQELDPVAVGEGVAGVVAARGEALLVEDVGRDDRFPGPRPDHYTNPSFLAVPLRDDAGCYGVLCATDREGGEPFSGEDLDLLRLVSASLAPVLNGGAPPEPAAAALEDAGTEPDAELARAVCDAVNREVEPERVLRAALEAVAQPLEAELVSLYLLDRDGLTLRREAQWEGSGGGDREALPRDRGLCGSVFESGLPVASPEAADDPRFEADVDGNPSESERAPCLVVPLRFRGKSLGLVRVFSRAPQAASPKTAEVLTAVLSAAARNVLLYRSLVDSVEELAQARRETQV